MADPHVCALTNDEIIEVQGLGVMELGRIYGPFISKKDVTIELLFDRHNAVLKHLIDIRARQMNQPSIDRRAEERILDICGAKTNWFARKPGEAAGEYFVRNVQRAIARGLRKKGLADHTSEVTRILRKGGLPTVETGNSHIKI